MSRNMTENEAIVQLNFDMEMIRFNPETGETLTLEQIEAQNEANYKTYLADEMAITALIEIQQYRAIDTVEECRTAVERMKPRKPKESKMWNLMLCPNCGNNVTIKEKTILKLKYCCDCGQAIDWSE